MSQMRAVHFDDLDRRIVAILQSDGRRPYSRIAAELSVSEASVRYRVARLEASDLLQIVGVADPLRLGFDTMALVGVRLQPSRIEELCATMARLPEVAYVAATTGSYDAFVEVLCTDRAHYRDFLLNRLLSIDGVQSADSFMVLQLHKLSYRWGVPGDGTGADGADALSGRGGDGSHGHRAPGDSLEPLGSTLAPSPSKSDGQS
jgi:Lrp/AsnC family transcriptional regulator, regulator for asnA, asnC and gidA